MNIDIERSFRNFCFFCVGVVLAGFALLSHAQTCDPVILEIPWDSTAFEYAVGGGLLMFATGFGVGLVLNAVRKMRTP